MPMIRRLAVVSLAMLIWTAAEGRAFAQKKNPKGAPVLLLTGGAEANDAQCESLIRLAVETCERYFPAVQFVVWAGRNAGEALESSLLETVGEA